MIKQAKAIRWHFWVLFIFKVLFLLRAVFLFVAVLSFKDIFIFGDVVTILVLINLYHREGYYTKNGLKFPQESFGSVRCSLAVLYDPTRCPKKFVACSDRHSRNLQNRLCCEEVMVHYMELRIERKCSDLSIVRSQLYKLVVEVGSDIGNNQRSNEYRSN